MSNDWQRWKQCGGELNRQNEQLCAATHTFILVALIWISKKPQSLSSAKLGNLIFNIAPDRGYSSSAMNAMEGNNRDSLTVSVFQFEEKFIEQPEDLDKLKNGKTKN